MKLDPKQLRHLTDQDWRVLTAVEQGSRNHLVVPTSLITSITNLRGGSQISKSISILAKSNLISRVKNASYDGYRLAYGGLDYLALHAHLKAGTIFSVGNQIGVGKESDIFVVASPGNRRLVLKIHRLGRVSFRTVKANRDYLKKGGSGSWMYMSTLAARKEYTFMRALREAGFQVPEPVGWNRHTVVMELIDAFPLRQISTVPDPARLYGELIEMILRLARHGLIHADFNEFNILIEERERQEVSHATAEADENADEAAPKPDPELDLIPVLIDFPQTLSISHPNADFYFQRDVQCIKTFFQRRFGFVSDEPGPFFADISDSIDKSDGVRRLDIEVEASGFSRKMAKELEQYMKEHGVDGDAGGPSIDGDDNSNGAGVEVEWGEDDSNGAGVELERGEDDSNGAGVEVERGEDSEQRVEADSLQKEGFSSPTPEADLVRGVAGLDLAALISPLASTKILDTASVAGTARTNRPRVNPAKAAQGWAI